MFWRQTPRETQCYVRMIAARNRRQEQLLVTLAWHVAVLGRVERVPPLDELMAPFSAESDDGTQSPEDQLAAALLIAASFPH